MKPTELSPEEIIASSEVDAFVVAVYENMRPFRGLAFRLDWRFRGILTNYYQKGLITGVAGECTLVPIQRANSSDTAPYKLIVVGAGKFQDADSKNHIPHDSVEVLKKNILKLGIKKIGISKSDLGTSVDAFDKDTKGVEIWVTP